MATKTLTGQQWAVSADGGYLANPKLSKQLRKAALPLYRFRQFVRVEPGLGKNKGDTLEWNRVSKVATPGRAINEDETMPATKVTISRGQLTLNEYGNSIEYTGKLEALAEWDPENVIQQALKDDMAAVIDSTVASYFQKARVKYVPTGTASSPTGTFDTDGTLDTVATRDIMAFDVKEIVDYMKGVLYVPPYDGENYIAIVSTKFARKLKDDPDFEDVAKYAQPEKLFQGEIGKYWGVRFIEDNHVLSNTLANTGYAGEAIFFGEDPVIEGVAVPEEIRAKLPTDYGRDKGLAWYAILGWEIVWETANPGEARIVHVTSANAA